jgi:hypothetical protein
MENIACQLFTGKRRMDDEAARRGQRSYGPLCS